MPPRPVTKWSRPRKIAIRLRLKRYNETPVERAHRLAKCRQDNARRIAMETAEQKAIRLEACRKYKAACRSREKYKQKAKIKADAVAAGEIKEINTKYKIELTNECINVKNEFESVFDTELENSSTELHHLKSLAKFQNDDTDLFASVNQDNGSQIHIETMEQRAPRLRGCRQYNAANNLQKYKRKAKATTDAVAVDKIAEIKTTFKIELTDESIEVKNEYVPIFNTKLENSSTEM